MRLDTLFHRLVITVFFFCCNLSKSHIFSVIMSGRIKSVLSWTHRAGHCGCITTYEHRIKKTGLCCCISKPEWEDDDGSLLLQLWSHNSYVNLIVWRLSKHQGHSRDTNGFREHFMRKLFCDKSFFCRNIFRPTQRLPQSEPPRKRVTTTKCVSGLVQQYPQVDTGPKAECYWHCDW